MEAPQVVQVLKSDAFGRVELLDGPQGQVVRRVACGGSIPGSRWLARILLERERRALERLAGVAGVTRRLDLPAYAALPSGEGRFAAQRSPVLLRSWIEALPLWRVQSLPFDYFERLEELVLELHARGVCHNDLHKEPNVLVDEAGYPALVDFQLASLHEPGGRGMRARAREDLRHVEKHRRVYARGTGRAFSSGSSSTGESADASARAFRRRSLVAKLWMRFGKPVYNLVTRRLLRVTDGEPRRPSAGPWPRWTPAVGPRPRDVVIEGSSPAAPSPAPRGTTRGGTARC